MTEDYKENILKYITNNITPTTGVNEPQIPTPYTLNENVYNYLLNNLPDITTTFPIPFEVMGSIQDNTYQNILYYGYYYTTSMAVYGFIYIVDSEMHTLTLITNFSSGTKLFPLFAMNQDENGYMYALSVELSNGNYTNRVLLFNNILLPLNDTYYARLRQSYIIPNSNDYNFNEIIPDVIRKAPEEATYYILFRRENQNFTSILEFKINVGADNEWNIYATDSIYTNVSYSVFIEKNGEKIKYYLYSIDSNSNFVVLKLSDGVLTKEKSIPLGSGYDPSTTYIYTLDTSNVYISSLDTNNNKAELRKLKNNTMELLYQTTVTNPTRYTFMIKGVETLVYLVLFRVESNVPKMSMGILDRDNVYMTSDYQTPFNRLNYVDIACVCLNYNLVRMYLPATDGTKQFIFDYNPMNYNGVEYEDYNQTLAVKGRLYSNNKMVFARNIYNTTLFENIATSNLQVPNTFLNGEPIVIQDLVGATNGILLHNTTTITKNIYETLYVNFIRSISVKDEDTNTNYPLTANYVNQNINTATKQNCTDTFIGKVKINYTGSSIVQEIVWNYVTDHYETSFVIDALTEVPTIEFISNDETMIYITKELDISTGHYYKVSQKLRIE